MKISQREARFLKKRVIQLETILRDQKNRWKESWVAGWTNIDNTTVTDLTFARLETARKLGHAVVAVVHGNSSVAFYADNLEGK